VIGAVGAMFVGGRTASTSLDNTLTESL